MPESPAHPGSLPPLCPAQAISAYLGNKTVAATRLYWSRHRERLGLDAIMAERAAAGLGTEDPMPGAATAAAAALPSLQSWAPLLDQLQQQQQAGQASAGKAGAVPSAAALFAAAEAQQHQLAVPGGLPPASQGLPLGGISEAGSVAATPAVTPRAALTDGDVAADVARRAVAAVIAAHDGPPTGHNTAGAAATAVPTAVAAAAAPDGAPAGVAAAPPAAPPAPGAGEGGEAVRAAVSSAAASLLPLEELEKLQGLLQPGGLIISFASYKCKVVAGCRLLFLRPAAACWAPPPPT